jgi:hypothetical protein
MSEYAYLVVRNPDPTVAIFKILPSGLLVHQKSVTASDLTIAVSDACEAIRQFKEKDQLA